MTCGLETDRPLSNVQQIQRVQLVAIEVVVVDAVAVTVVADNHLVETESPLVANVSYYRNYIAVYKLYIINSRL